MSLNKESDGNYLYITLNFDYLTMFFFVAQKIDCLGVYDSLFCGINFNETEGEHSSKKIVSTKKYGCKNFLVFLWRRKVQFTNL